MIDDGACKAGNAAQLSGVSRSNKNATTPRFPQGLLILVLGIIAAIGSVFVSPEVSLATDRVCLIFWGVTFFAIPLMVALRRPTAALQAWIPPVAGLVLAVSFVQMDGTDADSRLLAQTLVFLVFATWLFHALWLAGVGSVGSVVLSGAVAVGWAGWLYLGIATRWNMLISANIFLSAGLCLPGFLGLACGTASGERRAGR